LLGGFYVGIFAVALNQVFDRTEASLAASLMGLAPLLTLVAEAAANVRIRRVPMEVIGLLRRLRR
jgi:hypothetical protein